MWPFKSKEQRLRDAIAEQYGDYLRMNGFAEEPEVPGRPRHLWGLIYRSDAFRLRITNERGQHDLFLSGAPLRSTCAWFEEDWYSLHNVVKWLNPSVPLHPKWTCGPDMTTLARVHSAVASFLSDEGAGQREQFIESTTWPATAGRV